MNYSYQREKILDYVSSSCDHPTAEMVYEKVRKDIPNISLGTVYRNLNTLSKIGKIKRIPVPNSGDRFDKTLTNHSHIYCIRCHKVDDIVKRVDQDIEGFHTLSYHLIFEGICDDCYKLERNE